MRPDNADPRPQTRREFLRPLAVTLAGPAALGLAQEARAAPVTPRPSGAVVLDDCDPTYQGKQAYEDNLTFLDASGKARARVSGLNICEEIGSPHRLAVDPARGRVWLTETVGGRLLRYDLDGKEHLSLPDVKASALAVEPATGHVWVARSTGRVEDQATKVYDADGKERASYDFGGYDIAYDPVGRAFWMAGVRLWKASTDGKVLVRRDLPGWCAVSVAADPRTGAVWLVTRQYDVGEGRNELLGFAGDGTPRHTIPLGERMPFRVAVDANDGAVWVTNMHRSLLQFSAGGRLEKEHRLPALTADADRAGGGAWVVTAEEILRIDRSGKVLSRAGLRGKTTEAWIASY
jgi:DNA-binding beta-propeller fold protein YncE